MASETPHLRAILPYLPSDIAKQIRTLCGIAIPPAEHVLETLIMFISGAECSPQSTTEARLQWSEKQQAVSKILQDLTRRPPSDTKRRREDDMDSESQSSKRQRSSAEDATPSSSSSAPNDDALFTLHSISATSPVRKKVDITIHKNSLRFTHPSTHALESSVPLSALTRAFLLPTRGKQKAHWTVVLLSVDTPDRGGKPVANAAQSQQAIFGIDAVTTAPLSTTVHTASSAQPTVLPKGSATRPALLDFLSRLGIQIIEPQTDAFKSACVGVGSGVSANEDGVPGIEAYRGAKPGSLWFTKEGILWGESKPCEFWSVEDLIGKSEGLRVVSASGRTCSVILTRKSDDADGEVGDDEEDVGVETEFGLVDSRERPGIDAWVRAHRHLFGKKKKVGENVMTGQVEEDSDEEDEDFEMDSNDEMDGSSSSNTSDEGDEDEGGSDKGDGENDAEGSDDGEDSGEELKEENHPLMRPGAMPRMTRAAIDMVVGIMEEDMVGSSTPAGPDPQSDDDFEEDELDD